jgi:hypothetical protein
LSAEQQADLVAFLTDGLTGEVTPIEVPDLP